MAFNPAARYGPGLQMVVCQSQEDVDLLELYGWKPLPAELAAPYAPDQAVWVRNIADAVLEAPQQPKKPAKPAKG